MKHFYKPQISYRELLERWLLAYTWIQDDGAIDFNKPRFRPIELPVDRAERNYCDALPEVSVRV